VIVVFPRLHHLLLVVLMLVAMRLRVMLEEALLLLTKILGQSQMRTQRTSWVRA
jgi:hypothetical protein